MAKSKVYIKNNISYTKHADSEHWKIVGETIKGWSVTHNVWAVDSVSNKGSFPGENYETGDPKFKKKNWRSNSFKMSSFKTSDLFIRAGSSAKNKGVNLDNFYKYLIANGSNFHTTNPCPSTGKPIKVKTISQQYDNSKWDIGAMK